MESIRAKGVKTAIGSASKNTMLILDHLITSLFDAIVYGNKVSRAKPDPEVFPRVTEDLSIPPTECVIFEDTEAGIKTAFRAGMKTVGVGEPSNLREAETIILGLIVLITLSAH